MRIVEIQQESELDALRSTWEELLQRSASANIFLTWEWTKAWWQAYGRPGDLRVLTASEEDGALVGIAPLRRQVVRSYGQMVQALSFLADGSNDSDYLDFLIAAGHEQRVMDSFSRHWGHGSRRAPTLLLNELPASSPNLPYLQAMAAGPDMLWSETAVPCATVHLPDTWDAYLSLLKPRFRTKVRSVLRNLENQPDVQFGMCTTSEDAERLLPILSDLHTRRWQQEGKPGVFVQKGKHDFYSHLTQLLLERGWLRFTWLEWNGQVLACQYGFEYAGVYSQLQEGYEPAAEHYNPGVGLRAWSIREFLSRGLREYDFLGGVGRHKADWGAEVKYSKRLMLAPTGFTNLLHSQGPVWEERLKQKVAPFVPARLMALRKARLMKAPAQKQTSAMHPSWVRQAAAKCYVNSPLPVFMSRVRQNFQVSLNGASPRLARRTEAAARILCYHRINDDRDPFFPAVATSIFEQEMRFLARHHKVVSLTELVDRLEGGSRDNVLAITFDDGYQDNCLNAFPILQRYGLPATVFLTTGSLDSREPIWFEDLAHALKTSDREYIDLEMDIPRRLYLRTPQERLAANGEIFRLLRNCPDSERRTWVPLILASLQATPAEGRTRRMLTWDQVRTMKAGGIDFGGHTVTHPFLSKATPAEMSWEVSECKRRIEEEIQFPVHHFAYPNGQPEDIGPWNRDLLQQAGYRAAVTTIWGMNYPGTDRLALRRSGPWEEAPALFACKLDWYQLVSD